MDILQVKIGNEWVGIPAIQGLPGTDGVSPSASVSKTGSTATITITDTNGTTTAEISDGDPTTIIDDTAGSGDTGEVWSADKVDSVLYGESASGETSTVDEINFAENATKYTSNGSYNVVYLPVVKGNVYIVSCINGNNSQAEYRFAFSTSIPANNVAGTYIGKKTANGNKTETYQYTAQADGYLGTTWYKATGRSCSVSIKSGGIDQRLNALEADIQNANTALSSVHALDAEIKGKTITLESGTYWGANTVGTSVESDIGTSSSTTYKRTSFALPAGKTVRIVGVGLTGSTRLYWAFDATTGKLIDISDQYGQMDEKSYYLRYDVDTKIYFNCINPSSYFIQIVDDISPWIDMASSLDQCGTVMQMNGAEQTVHAIRSMRRPHRSNTRPAVFLHFSDIHGEKTSLQRIVDFANDGEINRFIDDVICTGDVVKVNLDDGMTWFSSVTGSNKILLVPGNHDVVKNGSGTSYADATLEETYTTLFADRISNWNVTQPEGAASSYLGYYYKDYGTNKLRVIFLDSNHDSTYLSAEETWLESVLLGAYNNNYSVICVNHYMFDRDVCSVVDCSFSPKDGMTNEGSWKIPTEFISAVETFIGYGGDFACWLGGHVHQDHVILHNNGHQLCIGVSTASYDSGQTQHGDDLREFGTKSQDLFNIVAIDTYSKKISILRVGSDLTRLMNSKRHLCIDYSTRTVVWND